jgi:hypothetical protein
VTAFDELVARVALLEKRIIGIDDLPLAPLKRTLEQSWQPDGSVLVQPKSVTGDSLGRGTLISGEPRLRLVRGAVSAAGALAIGSGFTVVRTAVGTYTVTFTPTMKATPVLAFGVGLAGPFGIGVTANAATGFSVATFNTTTGVNADTGWHFTAIGLD